MASPVLRVRPALCFIDESGQFRLPREGEPSEFGLVATVWIPRTEYDLGELHRAIQELRRRVHGDPDTSAVIKGKQLNSGDRDWLADTIRGQHDWLFGHTHSEINEENVSEYREVLHGLSSILHEARPGVGGGVALRADRDPEEVRRIIEDLMAEYLTAVDHNTPYMAMLFMLFQRAGDYFVKERLVPLTTTYVDERPHASKAAIDLLARFSMYTKFPEVFRRRIGEMLGLDPTQGFNSTITSDDKVAGIMLADVVAYAAGMVARGQDEDGEQQRFLDRMRWQRESG